MPGSALSGLDTDLLNHSKLSGIAGSSFESPALVVAIVQADSGAFAARLSVCVCVFAMARRQQ